MQEADYQAAAAELGVPVAAVKAVADVESKGVTNWPDGRPPILFEAHWFGKLTNYRFNESHPNISASAWDKSLYYGGPAEYNRLEEAKGLDESAALESASWGAFQIMGIHWQRLGYPTVQAFVEDMQTAKGQLAAFVQFIKTDPRLLRAIRLQDWRQFAGIYNGPGQVDDYAQRIEAAYSRYARGEIVLSSGEIAAVQRALYTQGYTEVGPSDGMMGPHTQAAIKRFRTDHGLPPGIVDPLFLQALGQTSTFLSHQDRLDRLAQIAVQVGLHLAPGQELVMSTPVDALPLARRVIEHAYKAGASLVTTLFSDDPSTLLRFKHATGESFDKAAGWLFNGMATAVGSGAAWLVIAGDDPALLVGQDPDKVTRADRARWRACRPLLQHIFNFDINWSVVSYATSAWAKAVFPNEADEVAVNKLWDVIFGASRVDTPDPIAAWHTHNEALAARNKLLNEKRFSALHFHGPGTDLRVGLADDHEWVGPAHMAKNGIFFNPNIPSEEVGTAPHKDRVEGVVRFTKPLCYQGTLVEGITVRFAGGQIVEAKADKGQQALFKILETDDGARRLGEVALLPQSSPIAKSGLLFYNTLFDENAASHIALGHAYNKCFVNGASLTAEELDAKGANRSLIHIDCMIGSPNVDIDGIAADGTSTALMRAGEWV